MLEKHTFEHPSCSKVYPEDDRGQGSRRPPMACLAYRQLARRRTAPAPGETLDQSARHPAAGGADAARRERPHLWTALVDTLGRPALPGALPTAADVLCARPRAHPRAGVPADVPVPAGEPGGTVPAGEPGGTGELRPARPRA